MPLYKHIYQRKVVYWLSNIGVSHNLPFKSQSLYVKKVTELTS